MSENPFYPQGNGKPQRVTVDRILRLHELARRWIGEVPHEQADPGPGPNNPDRKSFVNVPCTLAYVDLFFSFGLARLGEAGECQRLLGNAKELLNEKPGLHQFGLQACTYRIQQALAGKPHEGPLAPAVLRVYEELGHFARYRADRLRYHFRILDPDEKFDPYRQMKRYADGTDRELATLTDLADGNVLAERIDRLLCMEPPRSAPRESRLRILSAALQMAMRLSKSFSEKLLDLALEMLDNMPKKAESESMFEATVFLLERSLAAIVYYGCPQQAQMLMGHLHVLVQNHVSMRACAVLVMGEVLRTLYKLDLRDDVERLVVQISANILQGRPLPNLQQSLDADWSVGLLALTHIAGGWLYLRQIDKALPVLDEARMVLCENKLPHFQQTPLACAYAASLGEGSCDSFLARLEEMLGKLGPLADVYTTNEHFARPHLEILDTVVLAVDNLHRRSGR